MSAIGRLRATAVGRVRGWLLGAAPRSPLPAEPLGAAAGAPAFGPDGGAPGLPVGALPAWGAAGAVDTLRTAHRLGAFAELARLGAHGDAGSAAAALALVDGWLRFDRPGDGPGWEHGTDLAARVVHLAAGLSWLGPRVPDELRARAAGSAAWHVQHLRARLPLGADDGHRRVAHHAAALIAAFTFSAIPDARTVWSEAVPALAAELDALVLPDGADCSGAPRFLAQSAWFYALAFAVSRANGVALPTAGNVAFARAARFLDRLAGEVGEVPALGEAPFGTVLAMPGSLPASLAALAAGWGLGGEPGPEGDARAAWFGVRGAPVPPPPKGWSVWSFAEAGVAVASAPVRGESLRVVLAAGSRSGGTLAHAAPLQLLVDVGGRPLLADPGSGHRARALHDGLVVRGLEPCCPRLLVARVDGRKARLEGDASLARGHRWEREARLEQTRLRVTDRVVGTGGAVSLRWTLGEGWSLSGEGRGWRLLAGGHDVKIDLAPELAWRLERGFGVGEGGPPVLVGEGELPVGGEITCSFELR